MQNDMNLLYFAVSHQLLTTIYVLKGNIEVCETIDTVQVVTDWLNKTDIIPFISLILKLITLNRTRTFEKK